MEASNGPYEVFPQMGKGKLNFLVIRFQGETEKIETEVKAIYGISGDFRRLNPYDVRTLDGKYLGKEVIYVRN